MISKFALILLVAVAVSANPAANKPWHWIHRRLTVSLNINAVPFDNIVRNIFRPRPSFTSETTTQVDCGRAPLAPMVTPAIVGGEEAAPHSYPWQVALFIDNMYFCGGSIIADEWVMTAAHCMDGANFVDVVAGAHNIEKEEPSQVTMRSTHHFVHEYWQSTDLHNDIAMIKLPEKVIFNDYIQPVCLPKTTEDDLPADVIVTPTGWGKTHDGMGGTSDVLLYVNNPIISNAHCAEIYGSIIWDNMICLSGADEKGTCNGDSGGPMNYKIDGITETRGIVSFGAFIGCQKDYPDGFTRVSHYLDWIKQHTGVSR